MAKRKNKKSKKKPNQGQGWRNLVWYFLAGLMVVSLLSTYFNDARGPKEYDFTKFSSELNKGNVAEVMIRPTEKLIVGKLKNGSTFKTYFIEYPELVNDLKGQNVKINVNPTDSGWIWSLFFQAFLPFILIALLWFFIFRQAQGASNQAFSFGKTRATPWRKEQRQSTTFKDVAGVDEAVEELNEIVEFLKFPKKFQEVGAKIPKGALLMGPPGTGKTLLAKAIAGEADVPFFSLSGSDFVEMFVGVGASRVRDLFNQAKKNQPCIIFVDEIDAVGRHRGAGLGGGHDEREQTLNQLLVEMDGFDEKQTIIVLAATNRPDILDPALLRPGRFDRQIVVGKPDVKGRLQILEIHARGKKIAKKVDLEVIAKSTPGFTGADLSNLINESALLTARRNKKEIGMSELEEATERVIAGPERKSHKLSDKEKEIVAYHEAGHAVVAKCLENAEPVHKISILPRGMALGYTMQLPKEDKKLESRDYIEDQIKVLLGGRIAEEIKFQSVTNGAYDDIKRATKLAHDYVCSFGMSDKLGTRQYGASQEQVFLGKSYSDHSKDYSEHTAREIDLEIKRLIDQSYDRAKTILTERKEVLDRIASVLIEREVIESEEFDKLMNGDALPPKKSEADDTTPEPVISEESGKQDNSGVV